MNKELKWKIKIFRVSLATSPLLDRQLSPSPLNTIIQTPHAHQTRELASKSGE